MTTEPRPLHTTGPWRENDGTIFAANGYWIAVVAMGDDWKANAAIIARAPELLEENARLRELLRECEKSIDMLLCGYWPDNLSMQATERDARNLQDRLQKELNQ